MPEFLGGPIAILTQSTRLADAPAFVRALLRIRLDNGLARTYLKQALLETP